MNVVRLFSLVATTTKDYLKVGISAKFQPTRSKSKFREKFLSRI